MFINSFFNGKFDLELIEHAFWPKNAFKTEKLVKNDPILSKIHQNIEILPHLALDSI